MYFLYPLFSESCFLFWILLRSFSRTFNICFFFPSSLRVQLFASKPCQPQQSYNHLTLHSSVFCSLFSSLQIITWLFLLLQYIYFSFYRPSPHQKNEAKQKLILPQSTFFHYFLLFIIAFIFIQSPLTWVVIFFHKKERRNVPSTLSFQLNLVWLSKKKKGSLSHFLFRIFCCKSTFYSEVEVDIY